ncbi:MAG: hypothetical protein F4X93_03735 [Proteobacteria bacterium]|nr:hypothetical protein [Pseudomonadota bacterium]MYB89056.1 hypothetical protein [Pseudomonadota bacterium]
MAKPLTPRQMKKPRRYRKPAAEARYQKWKARLELMLAVLISVALIILITYAIVGSMYFLVTGMMALL